MRRPLVAAAILAAVAASAAPLANVNLTAAPAAVMTAPAVPLAFNSGDNSELVTTLPVTKSGTPDIDRIVFCVDIGAPLPPGSVIFASAEMEVTSDITGYPPLVSGELILADSCSATTGTDITEPNGENCSLNVQHHCVKVATGVLIVGTTSRHFVSLRMHAASGYAAWRSGDVVKVEPDYGRLSVLVWPGTP